MHDSADATSNSLFPFIHFPYPSHAGNFNWTYKTISGIKSLIWYYPSVDKNATSSYPALSRNGQRSKVSPCDQIYDNPCDTHLVSINWFLTTSIEFGLTRGAYAHFSTSSFDIDSFQIHQSALSPYFVVPYTSSTEQEEAPSSSSCLADHLIVESQVLLFCWKYVYENWNFTLFC